MGKQARVRRLKRAWAGRECKKWDGEGVGARWCTGGSAGASSALGTSAYCRQPSGLVTQLAAASRQTYVVLPACVVQCLCCHRTYSLLLAVQEPRGGIEPGRGGACCAACRPDGREQHGNPQNTAAAVGQWRLEPTAVAAVGRQPVARQAQNPPPSTQSRQGPRSAIPMQEICIGQRPKVPVDGGDGLRVTRAMRIAD